jgi:hypothetical protein
MSLAITHQMLKYVWLPEYVPEAPVPKFSLKWWDRMIDMDGAESKRVPIGAHAVRNR